MRAVPRSPEFSIVNGKIKKKILICLIFYLKITVIIYTGCTASKWLGSILIGKYIKAVSVSLNYRKRRVHGHPIQQVRKLTQAASDSFGGHSIYQNHSLLKTPYCARVPDTLPIRKCFPRLKKDTFGSADVGFQYFYGYLKRPAISLVVTPGTSILVREEYNRYHQVGFDLATVLAGINLRGEFGANMTEDISGDDPSIYNPSLVWSLGFDSSLFAGITFNVQVAGSVRLFDDDVGSKPFDIEDGTDITKTRITTIVSRKFLRDQLEIKGTMISGIEDTDYYLIPSASWTRDDIVFELSAGFFGGSRNGELGCYRENDYLSASITLAF